MNQLKTWTTIATTILSLSVGCSDEKDSDTTSDGGNSLGDGGGKGDASLGGPDAGREGGSDASSTNADAGGGNDGSASADSAQSDQDGSTRTDGGDAGTTDGASGGDGASADAATDLTDPQIGAVTTAANTGEIAQAQAALPKLSNAQVKAFANSMVEMHGAAQTRQSALLQGKQITPQENLTSTALKQESDTIVAALMAASATDVDRLYIDQQVAVHTKVLGLLDTVLIPSAADSDLRTELTTARGDVQTHLTQAQQIKTALGTP